MREINKMFLRVYGISIRTLRPTESDNRIHYRNVLYCTNHVLLLDYGYI